MLKMSLYIVLFHKKKMLTYALKVYVKNFTNKNYLLKIMLINC